jgi:hypothetical protein
MRQWYRYILFRRATRFGRALVACALVPILLTSSVTTQAILLHDHHGHETHSHALTFHDLYDWHENSEYQHEEHQHGDQPADPTEDEDNSLVIVFELPMALHGLQVVSSRVAVSKTAPTMILVSTNGAVSSANRPRNKGPTSYAHFQRARSTVADILQANHALLL